MPYTNVEKPNGSRPITIEVRGEPLGVVLPEAEGYRFLAVRFYAVSIDGRVFESVEAARLAASIALADKH
jgi:hypothetical protein